MQSEGGVVTLSLIAVIASLSAVVGLVWRRKDKSHVNYVRVEAEYRPKERLLVVTARLVISPVGNGFALKRVDSSVRIGKVPVSLTMKRMDAHLVQAHTFIQQFEAHTELIQPPESDVLVILTTLVHDGGQAKVRERVHLVQEA